MAVQAKGLEARQGETAFAFMVLRLSRAVDRAGLVDVIRNVAPLVPDVDAFIEELPDELDETMRIIGMPWAPPEAGHAVDLQRRLIEQSGGFGVEAAWFFQTGTSLPEIGGEEDDEDDEDEADDDESAVDDLQTSTQASLDPQSLDVTLKTTPAIPREAIRATTTDDSWEDSWLEGEGAGGETDQIHLTDAGTTIDDEPDEPRAASEAEDEDADDENDDDDEDEDDDFDPYFDAEWSFGPPPQVSQVPFPVDGYPAIIDELDWEDFGVTVKLAGPWIPGEGTVLLGFHTMWLAPYGGRFRNTEVTIDRKHNAAHFWVDRFAVPSSSKEQVEHLLWILSKLSEVIPVVHARFGGATMAQKYGGLMGDTSEPFVLAGNPLIALHAAGGDVDAWIASQKDWSNDEIAGMLRELAIEIMSTSDDEQDDEEQASGEEVEAIFEASEDEDEDEEEEDEEDDEEDDEDDEEDEEEAAGRYIATYAGELLAARARDGKLDERVKASLRPLLDVSERYEHRRTAVVGILGVLRDRDAVPQMIRILDDNPIKGALDSIGKSDFLAATARALGQIGDPRAIPALAKLAAARGDDNDDARPAAADALAACLAAAPEPRDVDDAVFGAMLESISERNDDELVAELQLAYGLIARQLPEARRTAVAQRLREVAPVPDDDTPLLARRAALALAAGSLTTPDVAALRPLLHTALTSLDYNHEYTVRNLRVALRIAEAMPELVDAADVTWLTRFAEADVRALAHAVLDKLGQPMPPARVFDRTAARELDDAELVVLIGEPHVIGRAALIAEAGRRRLEAARGPIIKAAYEAIDRAREGGQNLLDPDARILEAAVRALRVHSLDAPEIALFDRMLRHTNYHVKWELLQDPPSDERLLAGMFLVLGQRWGWQEKTAREWLKSFQGTDAYEEARMRVGAPVLADDEDDGDEDDDDEDDDEDMN